MEDFLKMNSVKNIISNRNGSSISIHKKESILSQLSKKDVNNTIENSKFKANVKNQLLKQNTNESQNSFKS